MRIIPFSKGQIFLDPEKAAADIMSELRHRGDPMRLCSFLEDGETMLLVIDEATKMDFSGYVLSPFPDGTSRDVSWTVRQRYAAGYDTLSVFNISGRLWGLFRCSRELYAKIKAKRVKKTQRVSEGKKK